MDEAAADIAPILGVALDLAYVQPAQPYELTVDARDADAIGALDYTLEALRGIRVDRPPRQQVLALESDDELDELFAAHAEDRVPVRRSLNQDKTA